MDSEKLKQLTIDMCITQKMLYSVDENYWGSTLEIGVTNAIWFQVKELVSAEQYESMVDWCDHATYFEVCDYIIKCVKNL